MNFHHQLTLTELSDLTSSIFILFRCTKGSSEEFTNGPAPRSGAAGPCLLLTHLSHSRPLPPQAPVSYRCNVTLIRDPLRGEPGVAETRAERSCSAEVWEPFHSKASLRNISCRQNLPLRSLGAAVSLLRLRTGTPGGKHLQASPNSMLWAMASPAASIACFLGGVAKEQGDVESEGITTPTAESSSPPAGFCTPVFQPRWPEGQASVTSLRPQTQVFTLSWEPRSAAEHLCLNL